MTVAKYRVKRADEMTAEDYTHNGQIRCQAKSKASGQRCKSSVVPGAAVCRIHGGSASQVKRKAGLRLAQLVDPAIGTLALIMTQGESEAAKLKAANSILDRAGVTRQDASQVDAAKELLVQRLLELQAEKLAALQSAHDSSEYLEEAPMSETTASTPTSTLKEGQ